MIPADERPRRQECGTPSCEKERAVMRDGLGGRVYESSDCLDHQPPGAVIYEPALRSEERWRLEGGRRTDVEDLL